MLQIYANFSYFKEALTKNPSIRSAWGGFAAPPAVNSAYTAVPRRLPLVGQRKRSMRRSLRHLGLLAGGERGGAAKGGWQECAAIGVATDSNGRWGAKRWTFNHLPGGNLEFSRQFIWSIPRK